LLASVALAAAGVGTACARLRMNLRWAAIAPAAVVVAVFSFVSWRQSGLYIDRFTLFQAAKEKNPDCWMIYQTLGTWELQHDRPQESIECFLKALDLYPREDTDRAQIHANYGCALFKLGRTREGVREFELAFAAGKRTPAIIEKLRKTYRDAREIDKLLDFDLRLTSLFPRNSMFHNNYGLTLAQTDRLPQAIKQYQLAIELEPQNAEAFNNLGAAYYLRGEVQPAAGCYRQALQCKPDYAEAHCNLGGLFYQMDAIQDAIPHLETAASLKPDYVKALFMLAKCYELVHQNEKAIAAGRRAFEAARSKNQDRMAAEIENWLESVRDGE